MMEGTRLQPSHSAPDLTDLLDARTRDGGSDGWDEQQQKEQRNDIDDDVDSNNQLPTPGPSRSPTPDVHVREDDETFLHHHHLRMRSESPELLLRRRMQEARNDIREESPFTDVDGDVTQRLEPEDEYQDRRDLRQDTPMSMPPDPDSPPSPPRTSPSSSSDAAKFPGLPSRFLPASLWDYLKEEIRATELDGSQEMKAERVTNFFSVPMVVEQVR